MCMRGYLWKVKRSKELESIFILPESPTRLLDTHVVHLAKGLLVRVKPSRISFWFRSYDVHCIIHICSYLSYAKDLSWLDACLPLCMTAFESLSSKKQLTVLGKTCILHPVHQLMHPCWHCTAMLPLFWKYNYVRWEMQMRHLLHLACHSFTIPRSASVYLSFFFCPFIFSKSAAPWQAWEENVVGLFARACAGIENAVFCGRLLMD